MLSSQIPAKFTIPFANNAAAGQTNPIPTNSQVGITPGAASLHDGFPPLTFLLVGAGGVPPWGRDFNGLFNQISAWNRWQSSGGPVAWDAAFSTAIGGYPLGAFVSSTTTINLWWLSLVENNTSNPDTGGANWYPCSFSPPVVGSERRLIGNAPGATQTASWTVRELVAKTKLGGAAFLGSSLSLNFNGATVGAGGMDTGSTPTSGDLNIYAIFNAVGGGWNTLGTIACNGDVYTGSNLPVTYSSVQTASALLWSGKCNASGILAFNQVDRKIFTGWWNEDPAQEDPPPYPFYSFLLNNSATVQSQSLSTVVPANVITTGGNATCSDNQPLFLATSGMLRPTPGDDSIFGVGMTQIGPSLGQQGNIYVPWDLITTGATLHYTGGTGLIIVTYYTI